MYVYLTGIYISTVGRIFSGIISGNLAGILSLFLAFFSVIWQKHYWLHNVNLQLQIKYVGCNVQT